MIMNKDIKPKRKVSYYKLIIFFVSAYVFGFLGLGLPGTIDTINGLNNSVYAKISSYVIISVLFWLFMKDYSVYKEVKVI
jgi:hypothetical protein